MRNRHMARVCGNCQAPMASGEDTCWRCGVAWAPAVQPPARLRLVTPIAPEAQPLPQVAAAVAARPGP